MRTLSALPVAALAAATLVLGACTTASQDAGSGGAASGSPAPTQGYDVSGITADETVAALVPAEVAETGTLAVGSNLEYAPAEFVAADGRTPVGFDIDIIHAVAQTMGLEAQVQSAGFDSIIPAIGSLYDVGISAFTITPERLETVTMISYFSAGSQLAVAQGNPSDVDPADLCGVVVGVQTGTIQQDELATMTTECTEAGKPAIDVRPYASQADVTTNLAGGNLEAMYADSPIVGYAVEQTDGAVEAIGEIVDAAPYGIVVAKDQPELAQAVQAALQKLMDDGTLKDIAGAWGNEDGALTQAQIDPTA
ncbi:ABC transporter substrate-binding protein [Xylanimonas oleitrophica]|uniref:ABC transporter substrate-binding protein n=1 Tax=Xylanimonas oleitrophica TaxID=2607479 RepID=A0A2W5WXA0_9MICO|nr:ABC transporter substrate-binding protein [Xylanimonas oleitrophica]PZR52906.1 ABC transporter substrate-binding protein [Xylanimonas oleitrophica]